MIRWLGLGLVGCASHISPVSVDELVDVATPMSDRYERELAALKDERVALAQRYEVGNRAERRAVVAASRDVVLDAFANTIFPAWKGTPWAFYGESTTPKEGQIACGYFVGTTLSQAGFNVDRIALGDQPAEWIIDTFVRRRAKTRFRRRPGEEVVQAVIDQGPGVYVLGLDTHVAYLVHDPNGEVEMCHASGATRYGRVVCEEPVAGMNSEYRVIGKLFDDAMIRAWLSQSTIPVKVE